MTKPMQYGLAAAAVVVVAVIGYQLIGGNTLGGPTPTPTPEPTSTPVASAEASAPADGSLPVGSSWELWGADLGIRITVSIPAAGWFGNAGGVLKKNDNAYAPDGARVTVLNRKNDLSDALGDVYIYGDPCQWASTQPDTPVTTVDEAIAALSAQPSRDASTPVDVTYDGYAGQFITLHVPDDAVFSDCDHGEFRTLIDADGGGYPRIHEDPGQFDVLTVLDVNGELVIFDVAYFEGAEGTPESVLDEMAGIMESVTFKSYDGSPWHSGRDR